MVVTPLHPLRNEDETREQFHARMLSTVGPRECPICGVLNVCTVDADTIEELSGEEFDVRGRVIEFAGEKYAHGTGCWDSPFGDECGGCLNTVINEETALVGPMGMCH